jgi:hypothetical protein
MAEWSSECVDCPSRTNDAVVAGYALIIALAVVGLILFRHCSNNGKITANAIFIDYVQNVVLIIAVPQTSSANIASFLLLRLDMVRLSSRAVCVAHIDVLDKSMIPIVVLFYLALVLAGFEVAGRLLFRLRGLKYNLTRDTVYVAWTLFYVFYGTISSSLFTLVDCATVDGQYVMSRYPASGACFQGRHLGYVIVCLVLLILVYILFPCALLFLYRRRFDPSMHAALDALLTASGRKLFREAGERDRRARFERCKRDWCCCLCIFPSQQWDAEERHDDDCGSNLATCSAAPSGDIGVAKNDTGVAPELLFSEEVQMGTLTSSNPKLQTSGTPMTSSLKANPSLFPPGAAAETAFVCAFTPGVLESLAAHGQFFIGYNKEVRSYYAVFLLLRRTVFVSIASFLAVAGRLWMRPVFALFAVFCFLVHMRIRPYADERLGSLQAIGLMYIVAVAMLSTGVYNSFFLTDYVQNGYFEVYMCSLCFSAGPFLHWVAHLLEYKYY